MPMGIDLRISFNGGFNTEEQEVDRRNFMEAYSLNNLMKSQRALNPTDQDQLTLY